MNVPARRLGSAVAMAIGLLMAGGGVASAHVTVAAPGVTAGSSDAAITFRVPTESATASTVGLKLALPTDTPLVGVLVAPETGWTAKVTNTKLAKPITTDDGTIAEVVSEIDWTADAGAGIKPGYFGQFTIIAGQLPVGADTLTFKVVQSYSDNSVVSWIEQAAPGSTTKPDHPAPTLNLPAAVASAGTPTAGSRVPAAPPASAGAAPSSVSVSAAAMPMADPGAASRSSVTLAIIIGVTGVLVGAAGVGLALASRRRPAAR